MAKTLVLIGLGQLERLERFPRLNFDSGKGFEVFLV